MAINPIIDILTDIRAGKPVIIMDDENRENEGDLIVAAEKITPEIVNFMIKEARGLICLAITKEQCQKLELQPMVVNNQSSTKTAFMVSVEAAKNVTTGISAYDRATTILAASNPQAVASDIISPGHIFPLQAKENGVLTRKGHTEAGCDLTRLAGLTPAAAIIEIIKDDGTMARRTDIEKFAKKHGFKIGTVADLIEYRTQNNV